jgi:energy-coupling factor transporter ATP-binding protein EcfA2
MLDAPTGRWSYDSIVAFLHGATTAPTAHAVFDALMASLRRYVHHGDDTSYVVDVLWAMGTYFYRMWNAYPYLALHGEKGAGKSTLLTWLSAVCFNAEFVVNTSEASLYRSIQAKAPTLLIDEQEGLNSSKAAKETKADLMGILKSGYKSGAKVARQDMDQKERTRYFDVYSPKALAAIELFEDVLENRAILTFMNRKPAAVQLDDDGAIITRDRGEFGPLRDMLYLLLMERAGDIPKITARVQMDYANRMRELLRPLYAMAALVDLSRGSGRATLDALDIAAKQKADLRDERDRLSPEAMLRDALRLLCDRASDDPSDLDRATIRPDGTIVADTIQVGAAFRALFSTENQSFYNDTWFGKQVTKIPGVSPSMPRRRIRTWFERDPNTFEQVKVEKWVTCYQIDPALIS